MYVSVFMMLQSKLLLSSNRTNKGPSSQGYGFSSSHIWMWDLEYKESWAPKKWCFWAVVLERTLESPLDCKEIQLVHPKGNQSWMFIGRTDAETENPILWPPDGKSWLIWKDPDAEKDWGQEKWTTEDEMVGWHHWLNGHEFEWALGVGECQGSLACCSPWDRKESDTTGDWTEWEILPYRMASWWCWKASDFVRRITVFIFTFYDRTLWKLKLYYTIIGMPLLQFPYQSLPREPGLF